MVAQTNHQKTKITVENKRHSNLFTNGEKLNDKNPHQVIFRLPLPELHYYHNKRLQARNLKYLTNLQLNPYPNIQLDLFCSDSSPF